MAATLDVTVANQGFPRATLEADGAGVQPADQSSSVPPTTSVNGGALNPIVGAAVNVTVGLGVSAQVRAGSGLVREVYV